MSNMSKFWAQQQHQDSMNMLHMNTLDYKYIKSKIKHYESSSLICPITEDAATTSFSKQTRKEM